MELREVFGIKLARVYNGLWLRYYGLCVSDVGRGLQNEIEISWLIKM